MPKSLVTCIALAGTCVLASYSHAEQATEPEAAAAPQIATPSPWTVSTGLKVWESTWQSWAVVPTVHGSGSRQLVEPIGSTTAPAVIPQISIRNGNWQASASALLTTNYTLTPDWGSSLVASRSESDLNIGYYVLPGVAIAGGYKQIVQNFGGIFNWSGPTLSASGGASIGGGLALYATVGVGFMNATLDLADAAGSTSFKADYAVSEAGLVYPFPKWTGLLKSSGMTVGYRSQTLTTKGYALQDTSTSPTTYSQKDVRDTTQGWTFGLFASF